MRDEWEFYFTRVNDKLASIFVNLGYCEVAPDETRPWLYWVFLYMQQPRDDGLSSSGEVPLIQEIEDALIERMRDKLRAVHPGRITTDGRRELYFYANAPSEFGVNCEEVFSRFPKYEFDSGSRVDSEWNHYQNVLSPTPEDQQRIGNRNVIESLKRQGDPLTKRRRIDHWAYFSSPVDRSHFAEKVVAAGFVVVQVYELDSPSDENSLVIQFERVDDLDWQSINDVTIELFREAKSANGSYDGWETSVEKDQ